MYLILKGCRNKCMGIMKMYKYVSFITVQFHDARK